MLRLHAMRNPRPLEDRARQSGDDSADAGAALAAGRYPMTWFGSSTRSVVVRLRSEERHRDEGRTVFL